MEIMTYNLQVTDNYYEDIQEVTKTIIDNSVRYTNSFIRDFADFSNKTLNNALLDILSIGVYWNEHIQKAVILNDENKNVLTKISKIRRENPNAKNDSDYIKGVLNKKLLKTTSEKVNLTVYSLNKLLGYLDATDEYHYQIKELNLFKDYLESKSVQEVHYILKSAILLALYFESVTQKKLSKYTHNVDYFLNNNLDSHIGQEDLLFCSKKEVEYHLNMVGAEIMNMEFESKFHERKRKLILVPGCMRINNNHKCIAEETVYGLRCNACNGDCNVKKLINTIGQEVYVIPHESDALSNLSDHDKNNIAVVGIACILELINGGLKSEDLGIPAQCVIIDSVGCSNHWKKVDTQTTIDEDKLKAILKA